MVLFELISNAPRMISWARTKKVTERGNSHEVPSQNSITNLDPNSIISKKARVKVTMMRLEKIQFGSAELFFDINNFEVAFGINLNIVNMPFVTANLPSISVGNKMPTSNLSRRSITARVNPSE